jgi:hypothetical protein
MAYAKATKKERKIKIEEFCPAPVLKTAGFFSGVSRIQGENSPKHKNLCIHCL